MDPLVPFFEHFALSTRMFYSGAFCGVSPNLDEQTGYLHVLKKGRMKISQPSARPIVVDTPSIVFLPRPHKHRLHATRKEGAELVCATIEFGTGVLNPLTACFPEPFILPLSALPELVPALQLLFAESTSELPGRQTALDRLFEYVLVLLFRSAMNMGLVGRGVLPGLSDPRLSKAIGLMHKHPGTSWSLEELAHHAGMSRARFAAHFRKVVGVTPFHYFTDWRLGIAQTMLRKGSSLKLIAAATGYTHSTALTRVFTQRLGISPTEWLRADKQQHKR